MTAKHCLRCLDVRLDRLPESREDIEFFECSSCRRHFASRPPGAPLTYRWLHPITLALYGVIFDADPVPRAISQADRFMKDLTPTPGDLRKIVAEIELELEEPTQRVRDALESRATEEKCREYLRAFTVRLRERLVT